MSDILGRLRRTSKRLARARTELDSLISEARAAGYPVRTIADAAGLSHVAVLKKLRQNPPGSEPSPK